MNIYCLVRIFTKAYRLRLAYVFIQDNINSISLVLRIRIEKIASKGSFILQT